MSQEPKHRPMWAVFLQDWTEAATTRRARVLAWLALAAMLLVCAGCLVWR